MAPFIMWLAELLPVGPTYCVFSIRDHGTRLQTPTFDFLLVAKKRSLMLAKADIVLQNMIRRGTPTTALALRVLVLPARGHVVCEGQRQVPHSGNCAYRVSR